LDAGKLPVVGCLKADVEGASLIGVPTKGVFDEWGFVFVNGSSTAIESPGW